jgi:hypothetical protein
MRRKKEKKEKKMRGYATRIDMQIERRPAVAYVLGRTSYFICCHYYIGNLSLASKDLHVHALYAGQTLKCIASLVSR